MLTDRAAAFVQDYWDDIVAQLPPELDRLATEHGVLKYHRCIPDAAALIRLAFAYSILDLSLRSVAAWGASAGVCKPLSDVAVLKQLRSLRPLVAALLQRQLDPRQDLATFPAGFTLVDGTSFGGPGGKGADWRVNLSYSGSAGLSVGIDLTTGAVGERFDTARLRPDDVIVGDRHYCRPKMLADILDAEAHVLVRAVRTFRLRRPDGRLCSPDEFTRTDLMKPGELCEHDVNVVLASGRILPMRLIIVRKTDASAARTARQLRRLRTKKQRKNADSADALIAGRHVYLLTSIPRARATAGQLAAAYRFRWQVELAFKRWKSLLGLDRLRAKGDLAETYILCKLLVATLIEAVLQEAAVSPWGARFTRAAATTSRKARQRPWKQAEVADPTPPA